MDSHLLVVHENYDAEDSLATMMLGSVAKHFAVWTLSERAAGGLKSQTVGSAVTDATPLIERRTLPSSPAPTVEAEKRSAKPSWTLHEQEQQLAGLLIGKLSKAKSVLLARNLIDHFGSLPAVLSASPYRQRKFPGMTEGLMAQLQGFFVLAEMIALERIPEHRRILGSWSALLEYLHVKLANQANEQFHILFLDKKNRLILDELQQIGTVDHVMVYPREVIKRALEVSATALILVHNHPSGDPSPSAADVRMTRELAEIARPLGIALHDHIIIARSGHTSMRGLRLL